MTVSIFLILLQGMGRWPLAFLVEEKELKKKKEERGMGTFIRTILP